MSILRAWVRRTLPLGFRQSLAHSSRRMGDFRSGIRLSNARNKDLQGLCLHTEITQPIKGGTLFENKLANLTHGARLVNLSRIAPNTTWSFWRYIQQPNERNGFVVGRNLVNGELTRQVGGGLCQLSSLIYHLGLAAGMTINERHPHSIDIYREHERFTPLGADATVVWGHKDLRLTNPHAVDLVFECFVHEHFLTGRVHTGGNLPSYEICFEREQLSEQQVRVNTLINHVLHTQTQYEQKQGLGLSG